MGSRAGAMVRALASHRCGPGSIQSSDHMWAKFVFGSLSAPRSFSPGTPVFPSPQKPAVLNSSSTRNARTHNTWASGSGDGATTPRVIEQLILIWKPQIRWDDMTILWNLSCLNLFLLKINSGELKISLCRDLPKNFTLHLDAFKKEKREGDVARGSTYRWSRLIDGKIR